MKHALWIFIILATFINCNSDSKYITINEKTVVLFSITQEEYDEKIESDEGEGIDEILSDFNYYADNIEKAIKSHSINFLFSTSYRFKFILSDGKIETFDRRDKEHMVGFILFDTKRKPKILSGVYTDVDIMIEVEKYFKIN